jgi:hypothetical protein
VRHIPGGGVGGYPFFLNSFLNGIKFIIIIIKTIIGKI